MLERISGAVKATFLRSGENSTDAKSPASPSVPTRFPPRSNHVSSWVVAPAPVWYASKPSRETENTPTEPPGSAICTRSPMGAASPVSADGRYRWIVQMGAPPFHISSYLPYYFLIFVAVGFVCWLLAVNIASPLRVMARTVDQFGAGDLSARVNSNRKDEL